MLQLTKYLDINIAQETCDDGAGDETRVFVYNVDGLLMDCGPQSKAEGYTKWFKTQEIKKVALTHNHEDHSGNARWIQDNLKVPIYLHELAITGAKEKGMYPIYRQKMWGLRDSFTPQPMPNKIETDKYSFTVLDTPGHSLYHNCFFEPNEGWLFTGDLYLGTKLFVCFIEENIRQTISTIERLMELDFDTIFCAHSGVKENGKVRLGKKLQFLKDLQGRVIEMREKGMTDREIDDEINGFDFNISPVSCGEWSSYNIIRTI